MKNYKLLLLSSALAMSVSAYGSEALAFGDLFVTVDKVKNVTVTLDIEKDKDVDIRVDSDLDLDGAAEADSVVNQENFDNSVESLGERVNPGTFNAGAGIRLRALLADALNDNTGVIQVNQDVGYMTNQGNVAAVAVINAVDSTDFADAQASAQQENDLNTVNFEGGLGVDNPGSENALIIDPDRSATIINSINTNSGIVHVNQNAGAMNNQLNDVAIAVADESAVVALAEADLGQFNTNNSVVEVNTVKRDLITNSINSNTGIVNVNQSTGNMNNQGTVISFAGLATIN